jgi:hypothetical protein
MSLRLPCPSERNGESHNRSLEHLKYKVGDISLCQILSLRPV